MISNLSRQRRYGVIGDTWSNVVTFFKNVGGAFLTITVRNFQGNTSTQTIAQVPHLYVVGPPQYTINFWTTTIQSVVLYGQFQGLYIRERESTLTPDGNVWFRWEEDQRVLGSAPTTYSIGVF